MLSVIILFALLSAGAFFQEVEARGSAGMMGNLQVVSSDGPFDVRRSPAAITFGTTSAGIIFEVSPWTHETHTQGITVGVNNSAAGDFTIDSADSEYTLTGSRSVIQEMAVMIAMGKHVTLGISEKSGIEDTKTSSLLNVSITAPVLETLTSREENNDETLSFNTGTSLSIRLTETLSLGFGLQCSSVKKKTLVNQSLTTSVSNENTFSSITASSFQVTGVAGFMHKNGNHQTGINVYPGRYTRTDFSYHVIQENITTPSDSFEISDATPSQNSYTEGAALIAGHHWRFNRFIAAAVEAGIGAPCSFTWSTLHNQKETFYPAREKQKKKISIFAAGGLEINPLKNFSIAFGGSYQSLKGTISTEVNDPAAFILNEINRYSIHAVTATTGLSLTFFSNLDLNFTARALYLMQKSSVDSTRQEIEATTTTISTVTEAETDTLALSFRLGFVKKI